MMPTPQCSSQSIGRGAGVDSFITSHNTSEWPSAGGAAVTPRNSWKLFFEGGFLISCDENM